MKKETLYLWIIALLAIVNVFQLGAFLLKPKPPRHEQRDFKSKAIETLQLNNEQATLFEELARGHKALMDSLNNGQRTLTVDYFNSALENNLRTIEEIQTQKMRATQSHFAEIEALLTPAQIPYFKGFKGEAIKIILH